MDSFSCFDLRTADFCDVLDVNELHSSTSRMFSFHFLTKLRNSLVILNVRHCWILQTKLDQIFPVFETEKTVLCRLLSGNMLISIFQLL